MFLLLWLFFLSCAYASEETLPLFNVVIGEKIVIGDKEEEEEESTLLVTTKEKYVNNKEHWKDKKVHFFNPIDDKVESFPPSDPIENLCLMLEATRPLSVIPKIPEIQTFFQNNKLYPHIPNQLEELFESIDKIGLNRYYIEKTLYHFKLLLYCIEANNDGLGVNHHYKTFLMLNKECTLNGYNSNLSGLKKFLSVFLTFATISCTAPIIAASSRNPRDDTSLIINGGLFGSILSVVYGVSGGTILQQYNAYKAYCKNLEAINEYVNLDSN